MKAAASPTNETYSRLPEKISKEFEAKVAIAERMVFINQFINYCADPDMLKWIQDQVAEPFGRIRRRLEYMADDEDKKKHLQNGASVK